MGKILDLEHFKTQLIVLKCIESGSICAEHYTAIISFKNDRKNSVYTL